MTLTPAYGRQYKTKAEVLAGFNANRDFIGHAGLSEQYINKEQLAVGGRVKFRYGKRLEKEFMHEVTA